MIDSRLVASGLAVIAVAVAITVSLRSTPQPEPASALPTVLAAPIAACPVRQVLAFSTSAYVASTAPDGAVTPFATASALTGELTAELVAATRSAGSSSTGEKVIVRYHVTQAQDAALLPDGTRSSTAQRLNLASTWRDLTVFAAYDRDGRLTRFLGEPNTSEQRSNPLRSLLSVWQLVRPQGAAAAVAEPDSIGMALFQYQPLATGWFKTKTGYASVWHGRSEAAPRLISSEARITARDGALLAVTAKEVADWPQLMVPTKITWTSTLSADHALAFDCANLALPTPLALAERLTDLGLAPSTPDTAADPAWRRRALAHSLPALFAVIADEAAKDGLTQAAADNQVWLTNHLDAEPEGAAQVRDEILAHQTNLPYARRLIGAMGAASSADVAAEMLTLMQHFAASGNDELLAFTARSQAFSPRPLVANVDWMMGVAAERGGQLANDLELAATAAASRLAPADTQRITKTVLDQLTTAIDAHKPVLIAALANTNDDQAFPVLASYAASPDQTLAVRALNGIGHLEGKKQDEVDRLLLTFAATNAKTLTERTAALAAMTRRPLSAPVLTEVMGVYRAAAAPKLRAACLNVLNTSPHRVWPAVGAFLAEVAAAKGLSPDERQALNR